MPPLMEYLAVLMSVDLDVKAVGVRLNRTRVSFLKSFRHAVDSLVHVPFLC